MAERDEKMEQVKINTSKAPKEIYVRVMKITPEKENRGIDLSKLKEEYDRESKLLRSWNIFSGGGIGASIGLIACLVTNAVGVPISSPETFIIVGGSVLLGIIAGFVLY